MVGQGEQLADGDLLVGREGAIVTITLNRPARRNAVRLAGWEALGAAVRAAGADESVRVIVVRGAGDAAFCAGADIGEFPTVRADRAGAAARRLAAREDQPRSDSPFVLAVLLVAGAGTIILALFLMTLSPR